MSATATPFYPTSDTVESVLGRCFSAIRLPVSHIVDAASFEGFQSCRGSKEIVDLDALKGFYPSPPKKKIQKIKKIKIIISK